MTDEDRREIPLTWIGVEDVPILSVTNMLGQTLNPNEFILTMGQIAPPILLGSEEQRREQLQMVTFAAVTPVARLGLSRQRVVELIRVLTETLENADKMGDEDD